MPSNTQTPLPQAFKLEPVTPEPCFSIAPFSSRMATAYLDRQGCCHLFTDYLDPDRQVPEFFGGGPNNPNHSWDGVIRRYSSPNLRDWHDHGTVVDKGRWTGDAESSDCDCIGAASPGLAVVGNRLLLFYSGRGKSDPTGPFCSSVEKGQPGALCGWIMLAVADLDEHGAPVGPFVKKGVVVELGTGWMSTRLDDPWPIVYQDQVLVFHKAMGPRRDGHGVVCALSRAPVSDSTRTYATDPEPALRVSGGGEMARIFQRNGCWNMLYRRFHPEGQFWSHYVGPDPFHWNFVTDQLFDRPVPGLGGFTTGAIDGIPSGDLAVIQTPFDDRGPEFVLVAGMDDGTFGDAGVLKQWLYRLEP